jgi:mannitol-specific phosphotransferase system IIBC component
LETDIAVTITTDNDTARQEVYNQLLQMMSTGVTSALSPQTLLTLLVEMNPHLPREVRDRIVQSEPIVQQIMQQQQQQQHDEKLKQQAADSVKRSQLKEAMQQEAASNSQQQQEKT